MGVTVVGVSLQPEALSSLDELAELEGASRSGMVARLVEAEVARRSARGKRPPEVLVDGARFVPARRARAS